MQLKQSALEAILECPVCMQEFDEDEKKPLVIPCGHTLCKFCVSTMVEEGMLKCPFCRKEMDIGEAAQLPVN